MIKGRFYVPRALTVLLALNAKMIPFHRPEIVGAGKLVVAYLCKEKSSHWHCHWSRICALWELLDTMLLINHFLSTGVPSW